jgi:S1-C subfamily serine protease
VRISAFLLFIVACSATPVMENPTTTTSPPATTTTLGAADVYSLVSPSLAFVETPIGSGSAVLLDAGLVTNAHVVWPADEVTISFPGGLAAVVAVIAYDWMADLALLDVSGLTGLPSPASLHTGPVQPGTTVYLVGYPADDQRSASPAITRGIVSRTRVWAETGMSFIQSDALISGGQSGGALLDEQGRVIGISGLSVGDGFALALAAADLEQRVSAMTDGSDLDGLGSRSVGDLTGGPSSSGSIAHVLDETVFVFDGLPGETVTIEILGSSAINADLVGPDGFVEVGSIEPGTLLVLEAEIVLAGPHFIVVYPESGPIEEVTVSGVEVNTWIDPDHGRPVAVGSSVAGNGDYPGDLDWFLLELEAGQTVTIRASSINIDASLLVDLVAGGALQSDSDSGGGVIGFDAMIVYTAPETGSYAVAVFDETGFGPGGYILTVEEGRR